MNTTVSCINESYPCSGVDLFVTESHTLSVLSNYAYAFSGIIYVTDDPFITVSCTVASACYGMEIMDYNSVAPNAVVHLDCGYSTSCRDVKVNLTQHALLNIDCTKLLTSPPPPPPPPSPLHTYCAYGITYTIVKKVAHA